MILKLLHFFISHEDGINILLCYG